MAVRHTRSLRDAIQDEAYGMRAVRCPGLAGFASALGLDLPIGEDGGVFLDLDGMLLIHAVLSAR